MRSFLTVLAVIHLSCGAKSDRNLNGGDLLGQDYGLFELTPASELAKAVEAGDAKEMFRIVTAGKVDIDYQEPKFGNTLLMLTVMNLQYASCKTLLELGADPNKHNTYSGSTALIEAAAIENYDSDNSAFLRLLITHGADVNEVEIGDREVGNTIRKSPLLVACGDVSQVGSSIVKVKMLVEAGADVNYKDEFNHFPLREALIQRHYEVVLYLLQKGADHNRMLFDRGEFQEKGKKIYIADILREQLFPLGTPQHKMKMEIVNFLESKGINYREVAIPDFVVKKVKEDYPANWQEYLTKY
jgi:hypothetical protein